MGNAQRRVASLRLCAMSNDTHGEMTDLLTPEVVREWQQINELRSGSAWFKNTIGRLCQSYLTLWDRNKELKAVGIGMLEELKKGRERLEELEQQVAKLETTIGWYEEKHPND